VSGFAVNTDALDDGAYAANLAITDAAGNVTNDALGSVTVSNPVATVSSLGALPGPGTTSSHTGSTGTGSPNGTGASEGAHLQLGTRSPIYRTYARRAVRITGRLLNAQGLPVAGASLDVLQKIAGATLELIGHVRTGTDGTFVARVAGGPSRMVEIGYRAFSADSDYSAKATFVEAVRAGVQLSVTPRRTGSEGTITLGGHVLGPVPPQGVVVELLVHYRGHWEPFRDPRTNSRGRFRVAYQFQGGIGRFPFRAVVFGNQGGFPFALGESRAVHVTTN
jgi:5-hydroxyisourate hydrolase-like protein (transthyretin family)